MTSPLTASRSAIRYRTCGCGRLDGTEVLLRDWHGAPLVIETGSVTCPAFISNIAAMNELAEVHPEVVFVVIYSREAHPGRRIGSHDTMAAKIACASQLDTMFFERRTTLVDDIDDIDDTAHRALGALPDMAYIVASDGTIAGRADWNDPNVVNKALQRLADEPRPGLLRTNSRPDMRTTIRVLRRAGWTAVADFAIGHLGVRRRTHTATPSTPE